MKFLVIQPQTFEDVLASHCYVVYWTVTALRRAGHDVEFHEDCTYKEAQEALKDWRGGNVLCDISTPPQVEFVLALKRSYPKMDLRAIGYHPLATHRGLPTYDLEREAGVSLVDGVQNYLYDWDNYVHAYATIDGHVVPPGDSRPFVPAFFGVGCKRGCDYCQINPQTYPYAFVEKAEGLRLLDYIVERGWNLHFEDENLFLHRHALDFIRHLRGKDTKWIALSDSLLMSKVLRDVGVDELLECGHWLTEIGLETTDPSVLGKRQDIGSILDVQNHDPSNQQNGRLNIFWLNVTMLPDETIASLNRNGRFYAHHGVAYERIEPRLRTQSSAGGLGQFFLPYPGTKFWSRVESGVEGRWIAQPALRLRPSWIGNALARDVGEVARPLCEGDQRWLDLYEMNGVTAERVMAAVDGVKTVEEATGLNPDMLAVFCCLAKLRVITPKGGEAASDNAALVAKLTRKVKP